MRKRPDAPVCLGTLSLILIPAILFNIYVLPFISQAAAAYFLTFVTLAISLANLLVTVMLDPGFLRPNPPPLIPVATASAQSVTEPRQAHTQSAAPHTQQQQLSIQEPNSATQLLSLNYPFIEYAPGTIPRITHNERQCIINGHCVKLKYCHTCFLWRPPRASHCAVCDKCCDRHDHHCPWMSNCIGRRNYRFFVGFLCSTTVFAMNVFSWCVIYAISTATLRSYRFTELCAEIPVAVFLLFYSFVFGWTLIGMSGYHLYLVSKNMTTREQLKQQVSHHNSNLPVSANHHLEEEQGVRATSANPYSTGSVLGNCNVVLCGPFSRRVERDADQILLQDYGVDASSH